MSINQITVDGRTMPMPTRDDINNLVVGDVAPHSLGESPVVSISYIGDDVNGKRFVGYYCQFGANGGTISGSLKEGEILWPINDPHTYEQRCAIRAAYEPGPLRDHYGYLINSMGQRI